MLADADAGYVRRNLAKFAAKLRRRLRLEIVHVDMAWPASQPQEDNCRVACRLAIGGRRGLEAQMVRHAQPGKAEKADLQKAAPRLAVTATISGAAYVKHDPTPCT